MMMELEKFQAGPDDVSAFYAAQPHRKASGKALKINRDLPRSEKGARFVKGPIPLDWLKIASRCGYRSEAVAILVWYAAGIQRSNPCKITPSILAELKVNPRTARRILERFQDGGLVSVEFHRGRSPLVTLKTPPLSDVGGAT